MNIKVVDFEILSRHYVKYQDGILEIEKVKQDFVKRLDPLKKEMQDLLKLSISGDDVTQKLNGERFQELQEQGMMIDDEFKYKMREMNDVLSKNIYSDLENLISEWSVENSIDMVIASTEVVYLNSNYYVTNDIIKILKDKDLYIDLAKEETKAQVIEPTV